MSGPQHDRAITRLEQQLEDEDDARNREDIMRELREIERDAADEERWLDEGYERGWR